MFSNILLEVDENVMFFGGKERVRESIDYFFVGIPFDSTSSFFPGSRFAPKIIRYLSYDMETNCIFSDSDFEDINVYDLGDIIPIYDVEKMLMRIEKVTGRILNFGGKIIAVGGEHTITLSIMKAFLRKLGRNLGLIVFDAHLDMRDEYPYGQKYSHATVMRRIGEIIGFKNISIIGVRAYSKDEIFFAKKKKSIFITSNDFCKEKVISFLSDFISRKKYIYLSIDVDVLNVPSVGNPEILGIMPEDILFILKLLKNKLKNKLVMFDIVEYNPLIDYNKYVGILVTKMIMEISCLFK